MLGEVSEAGRAESLYICSDHCHGPSCNREVQWGPIRHIIIVLQASFRGCKPRTVRTVANVMTVTASYVGNYRITSETSMRIDQWVGQDTFISAMQVK